MFLRVGGGTICDTWYLSYCVGLSSRLEGQHGTKMRGGLFSVELVMAVWFCASFCIGLGAVCFISQGTGHIALAHHRRDPPPP